MAKADCDICDKYVLEEELTRCEGCDLRCCEECIEEPCENDHRDHELERG